MSAISYLNTLDELNLNFKAVGNDLVILDFTSSWCRPCKMMAPYLEKLAAQFPDCHFYKIDVDEADEIASKYGISSMPTFIFLKSGQELVRFSGADQTRLLEILQTYRNY